MYLESKVSTISTEQELLQCFYQLHESNPLELNLIQVRELDKRYTHANPKRGKCTMDGCDAKATHWLTRHSKDYCQSDMVCHHHAKLWLQVKSLIS